MRKRRVLSKKPNLKARVQFLHLELEQSRRAYRLLQVQHAQEGRDARITWLEEQRKWDHLMLEHLVETAKWSAKKGVQSGLGR